MPTNSDDVDETKARERSLAQLTLGFIPLVDCAPLVVAKEKGFAADEGLSLELVREKSWANIRDRVMVGHFDAAHMLGPMPIASTLGIGHVEAPMIAPFSFGLGGNAITLSRSVFAEMEAAGARLAMGPAEMGRALAKVVSGRRDRGDAPLTLAVVHPFSGHNYELRYWLAAAAIDPDQEVRIIVLPPSSMAAALLERQIDGFCVGEPWNSLAVEAGAGVIAVTKSSLWQPIAFHDELLSKSGAVILQHDIVGSLFAEEVVQLAETRRYATSEFRRPLRRSAFGVCRRRPAGNAAFDRSRE